MHELGLCDALLKKVKQIAEDNELEGVNSVSLDIGTLSGVVPGTLSGVVPNFMTDCWEAVIDGTPFAETKLLIRSVPGIAQCLDCGLSFEANLEKLVCPACSSLKLNPVSGRDMTITEIEGY